MAPRKLVGIDEARRIVMAAVTPAEAAAFDLHDALGRVLAEDVLAEAAVPAFDSSAMDGFAVRAGDVVEANAARPVALSIRGESRAGSPSTDGLDAGQAIRISTGAMLPSGADAVVRVEDAKARDGIVEVLSPVASGHDVRRAGEDIQAGATVLRRGRMLGAAELGVLASLGYGGVRCGPAPKVAVLVTGDELLAPEDEPRPGAVRDTNSHTIPALVRSAGGEAHRVGRVGDDLDATISALRAVQGDADMVLICGGISVGAHDHVRPALERLGAREAFWGLALKPGRPTWFGSLDRTPVFGLPGNPVSAMVCFLLFVRPALRALQGGLAEERRASAVIDRDYEKAAGRAHAVRCRLTTAGDGWHVQPTGAQGSHILTSMLDADALAIIPEQTTSVSSGERVELELLDPFGAAQSRASAAPTRAPR
jgi:molybdenum cofactor synthesis domain-containing protein